VFLFVYIQFIANNFDWRCLSLSTIIFLLRWICNINVTIAVHTLYNYLLKLSLNYCRFWSHVCRSLLLFCTISAGKVVFIRVSCFFHIFYFLCLLVY
jgi:hypothetical protein